MHRFIHGLLNQHGLICCWKKLQNKGDTISKWYSTLQSNVEDFHILCDSYMHQNCSKKYSNIVVILIAVMYQGYKKSALEMFQIMSLGTSETNYRIASTIAAVKTLWNLLKPLPLLCFELAIHYSITRWIENRICRSQPSCGKVLCHCRCYLIIDPGEQTPYNESRKSNTEKICMHAKLSVWESSGIVFQTDWRNNLQLLLQCSAKTFQEFVVTCIPDT